MLRVEDLMQRDPTTVPPGMKLVELERRFLSTRFAGFPVVDGERLVGVISRSDVVRSMVLQRVQAEQVSDFYSVTQPTREEEVRSLESIAAEVGVRFAEQTVGDAMSRNVVSVEAEESIRRVAELMAEGHLHRVPVVKEGRLVGLVTSMDLVEAIAQGRLGEGEAVVDLQHRIE